MPGLVPGIHVFASYRKEDVDGRDKPGHDGGVCWQPGARLDFLYCPFGFSSYETLTLTRNVSSPCATGAEAAIPADILR